MLCRVTLNNRVIARHLAGRCNPEDRSMNHYAAVVSLLHNGVLTYRRRVHGFTAERIYGTTSRNAGFFLRSGSLFCV